MQLNKLNFFGYVKKGSKKKTRRLFSTYILTLFCGAIKPFEALQRRAKIKI